MVATDESRALMMDARQIHESAIERMNAGDIRDAAEKAWCAVKRSTDALILAKTGEAQPRPTNTSAGIKELSHSRRGQYITIRRRFSDTARYLHTDCFYNGHCEPIEFVRELILEVRDHINDCERMSNASD